MKVISVLKSDKCSKFNSKSCETVFGFWSRIPLFERILLPLQGYAKAGRMDTCFELYNLMRSRGLTPSQVTYGILLDGFINDNEARNLTFVGRKLQGDMQAIL